MSETRALSAALSGPTFEGAASRSALHASERHVDRWAPEGPAATHSRGMRSLAFADRVASPWLSASSMMNGRSQQMFSGAPSERSTPGVSWVFPRPWFQDELDWMAAARQSAESTPQFLTTRGTYASARTSSADVAMPVVAPELVVPSMMAGAMTAAAAERRSSVGLDAGMVSGLASAAAPMQHGLRSWSPAIPFAAAAAAEVMAGAVSAAASSGLSSVAERSPLLGGLAMVSPASMSGLAAPRAGQAAALDASTATIARIEQGRRPDPIAPSLMATLTSASSLIAPTAGSTSAESSSAMSTPSTSTSTSSAVSTPAIAASESFATSDAAGAAPTASPSVASTLSSSERAMSAAIGASPAMAGALRTIELLMHSASPSSAPSASARPSAAAVTAESAPATSAPGTAATAATPASPSVSAPTWSTLAPVVGPRVAMPAGLGGLAAALDTAHTISQPLARSSQMTSTWVPAPLARAAAAGMSMAAGSAAMTAAAPGAGSPEAGDTARPEALAPGFRGFAPVWTQPMTALAAVANDRARGVDHLAWSDRWLARFAGASSVAMTALDVAGGSAATTPRLLNANAPEVVYLHPELGPARMRAAVDASRPMQPAADRASAPAPAPRPTGVLRIDDGEAVPDSVFAALFAGPAPTAPTAPTGARRRPTDVVAAKPAVDRASMSMVDAVHGGTRPSAADLVAISAPTAPDAGLSPGLASSPMAAAMAGMLPLPQAPVFDPRALNAGGMATAYLGGLTARAAAPIGVLASAPTAGALASVARFGDVAAAGGAMGGWALRDLPLAPLALRLAEAAPERTMLATGGDLDIVIRGGGALARGRGPVGAEAATADAPSWISPAAPYRGPTYAPSADLEQVLLSPAARSVAPGATRSPAGFELPSTAAQASAGTPALAPTGSTSAPSAQAESAAVVESAAVAAPAQPSLPAIEPELLALRSALLASPTSWSAPLAHSTSPLLLSSALSVPSTGLTFDPAAMTTPVAPSASTPVAADELLTEGVQPVAQRGAALGASTRALSPMAMPLLTLPSVGGAAPSAISTAIAGHAATGAFTPPNQASVAGGELQGTTALTASGRPGALAEQALRWSVAEERSAAGLSFDFVSPEMVLAAKVYGLSPAAAAEASRIAVAGPSALASLATSLDLTFLRSFQQASATPAAQVDAARGATSGRASATASATSSSPALQASAASPAGIAPVSGAAPVSLESSPITATSAAADPVAVSAATSAFAAPADATSAMAPTAATSSVAAAGPSPAMAGWDVSGPAAVRSGEAPTWGASAPGSSTRMPRGAFLWPPGAVTALGLRAQGVDGVAGLPVVALELLAAQAVADLGTWVTAFPGADQAALASALRSAGVPLGAAGGLGALGSPAGQAVQAALQGSPGLAGSSPELAFVGSRAAPRGVAAGPTADASTREQAAAIADASAPSTSIEAVTAAATAEAAAVTAPIDDAAWTSVSPTASPAALRARFEAVYIALARSPEGLSLSPSARAARAMAVIAGSDAGSMSPRARAATVWSVMPQVFQGGLDVVAPVAPSDAAQSGWADTGRAAQPGLAGLASRAGEALGSFVAPRDAELATASGRASASPLADRVDSPVYVDTARPVDSASHGASSSAPASRTARPGRAFSQVGGGEPEIPAWFEGAARKLLEDKSGAGGMTLAELVLVTAMPEKQIAASTKSASSHSGHSHKKDHGKGDEKKPDVAKLAHDVYAEVLKLIESARERSGDPYQ